MSHAATRTTAGRGAPVGVLALIGLLGCGRAGPEQAPEGKAEPSAKPQASALADDKAPAAGGPARITVKSAAVGEERTVLVRTPPGYERSSERYPVLYMTDGDRHIAHTSATVEYLAGNGRMPEMIVVGISNTDRTRDLTPTRASMKNDAGKEMPMPTSGGADKFLSFIETELIPHVEKSYRTQPYRVFAGHSFGGLFAVHAFVSKPELFHAYISVAPSLQWDDNLVVKKAEALFAARPELERTLFMTLGDEPGEPLVAFNRFQELASKKAPKGFQFGSQHMTDEDHGSVVLRSHYAGLRKVFDGWKPPRDPATRSVGGLAAVDAHYKSLSKRFGFDVPAPEALLNELGYELMFAGKTDDAIAVFKSNVERHPASANPYDSLAEAYEGKGQLDLAVANYAKAVKLGEESHDENLAVFKANLERATGKQKQAANAPK